MAGIIVADTIQSGGSFIRLNSASQTVATINASGIYANTGNLLIAANGTIGVASITNTAITGTMTQAQIGTNVAGTGPAFSAYLTSDQTVSDAVSTKITFDTEEFDTNSNFASSRFTPTVAGYYYILTSLTHRQTNITDAVLMIYKNGNPFKRASEWNDGSSTQDNLAMSGDNLIYMNGSTDYVEVYLYSDGTGNATEIGGAQNTYFQGFLARAA